MPRGRFGFKHPTLTKEQILAMPAGPLLDKAVAMLIMGWQQFSYQMPAAFGCKEPACLIPPGLDDHINNIRPTPAFSTDEKEMLSVLDAVGCCCSWEISLSSEGCAVSVSGVPVVLCHGVGKVSLAGSRNEFARRVCQVALLSDARQGSCMPVKD